MPRYYDTWTSDEIDKHLENHYVLILFKILGVNRPANIIVHGDVTASQRSELEKEISKLFGGSLLTAAMCEKINEYANKWYKKNVLKKTTRVISFKRKKK